MLAKSRKPQAKPFQKWLFEEVLPSIRKDELSAKRGQKQLAGDPVQYTIVKVRARELRYSTADIGNGSALGKFVAKAIAPAFIERVGKYEVKHYQVNDVLDTAIKTYFGMKHSLAS